MTNEYKKLQEIAINQIDSALFSTETFYNAESIEHFRSMMRRWEKELINVENVLIMLADTTN